MAQTGDRHKLLPHPSIEPVDRLCLACSRAFIAQGKWLRLCPKCREGCGDASPYEPDAGGSNWRIGFRSRAK